MFAKNACGPQSLFSDHFFIQRPAEDSGGQAHCERLRALLAPSSKFGRASDHPKLAYE
jgi:hypothetical protein